ncbi:hypothetical protein L1887_18120 [Cichorium endivia]|nr:hypothetical protein L1887_18120 [Cichorium endivia]
MPSCSINSSMTESKLSWNRRSYSVHVNPPLYTHSIRHLLPTSMEPSRFLSIARGLNQSLSLPSFLQTLKILPFFAISYHHHHTISLSLNRSSLESITQVFMFNLEVPARPLRSNAFMSMLQKRSPDESSDQVDGDKYLMEELMDEGFAMLLEWKGYDVFGIVIGIILVHELAIQSGKPKQQIMKFKPELGFLEKSKRGFVDFCDISLSFTIFCQIRAAAGIFVMSLNKKITVVICEYARSSASNKKDL